MEDEYDFEEPEPESESDYQGSDDSELIRQEIYEDQENFARSNEDGWFYPDSEGGWEDNVGYESGDCE